jgi:hypothetical protein
MTMQALEQAIVPVVSEEEWNEITLEVAQETVESLIDDVAELVETIISPGVQKKPREYFEWFMVNIMQAYPGDRWGALAELAWLLDPGYLQAMKAGEAQPPMSLPWAGCTDNGILFKALQKKFKGLYQTQTKALGLRA